MIQLHNRVTIFPFPSLFTLLEDDIFWKTLQNQILVENQVHYNKIKTERWNTNLNVLDAFFVEILIGVTLVLGAFCAAFHLFYASI